MTLRASRICFIKNIAARATLSAIQRARILRTRQRSFACSSPRRTSVCASQSSFIWSRSRAPTPSSPTTPKPSILWRESESRNPLKINFRAFAYNYCPLCHIGNRQSQRQSVTVLLERPGRSHGHGLHSRPFVFLAFCLAIAPQLLDHRAMRPERLNRALALFDRANLAIHKEDVLPR